MNIIALSGSLRPQSYNTALLKSAQSLAPPTLHITMYTAEAMAQIPLFDPDLPETQTPPPVKGLQAKLKAADGIIISTPEYAYGVTGVLKNALDWLVASGELVLKPVLVWSVSTSGLGGIRAHYSLVITLSAMDANVTVEGSINIPFASNKFDSNGHLIDNLTQQALHAKLAIFEHAITES